MNVEDLARIKNYGEEGKATHRQENQQIKIFTMGHFASICVEIFVYNNCIFFILVYWLIQRPATGLKPMYCIQ